MANPPEPNTTLTHAEMLAIRDHVRAKLVYEYHQTRIIALLYRQYGNIPRAQLEDSEAARLGRMIRHLDGEDEAPHGTSIRLTTEGSIE